MIASSVSWPQAPQTKPSVHRAVLFNGQSQDRAYVLSTSGGNKHLRHGHCLSKIKSTFSSLFGFMECSKRPSSARMFHNVSTTIGWWSPAAPGRHEQPPPIRHRSTRTQAVPWRAPLASPCTQSSLLRCSSRCLWLVEQEHSKCPP